jgi:DNA-binding CsgD family transcriptional regulator
MGTGDYKLYQEVESFLKNVAKENKSPEIKAIVELMLTNRYIDVGMLDMIPSWLQDGDFSALPKNLVFNALLIRAFYFRLLEKHEISLTLAQTALTFYAHEKGLKHELTYFKLLCAAACSRLGRVADAKRYLVESMDTNLPHGFIAPYVGWLHFMDGLLEPLLKQKYLQCYIKIFDQSKRIYQNYITFHNLFTKDNITLILAPREYQIAMLAARRVPRAKIAKQFNITPGRLNNIIGEIYSKLHISSQKELSKYVQ